MFGTNLSPICLPIPTNKFRMVNKTATAIGLGGKSLKYPTKHLQEVNLTVRITMCQFFNIIFDLLKSQKQWRL